MLSKIPQSLKEDSSDDKKDQLTSEDGQQV